MLSPSAGGASMSRSFVAVGATIATLLLGTPALANTYHVHVRAGGPVGVVRGPGPVVVRGPVYVRGPGRVWVHRPHYGYRTYWNPYWYGYWYPVPLATVGVGVTYSDVYPAAPAAGPPPAAVVVQQAPRDPTIGVGMTGTVIHSGTDHPASQGLGALLRFRAHPVEIELEIGWDHYGSATDRTDTRLGGSLYVPLAGTQFQPFL